MYIRFSYDKNCYDVKLEYGDTATDYVEHQEQVKNLDFPEEIQLAKEDELEFSYTEKNGYKTIDRDSVYHVKNTSEYIFTGNESFSIREQTASGTYYFSLYPNLENFKYIDDYSINYACNYLKAISVSERYKDQTVFINLNPAIIFTFKDITTIDELKAWLKEIYIAGTPLIVRYETATPIRTQITDETFINQLEDLLNSETYKGVTHITTSKSSTEVADLILKVDYKQSNSSRIDALEKAILSIGGNI